jgi:hypothetical protein
MSITNKPRKNGIKLRLLRNFFEHRALWFYFIYDEALKAGVRPEGFAPEAIRRCGIYHGMRAITGRDIEIKSPSVLTDNARDGNNQILHSCRLLKKKLFTSIGKAVFEMKFIKLGDDFFDVDFHYCPLVNAWKKQGCSDKDIEKLCDWVMEGDRGIADAFGCRLELNKTIAKGDGVCEIKFRKI